MEVALLATRLARVLIVNGGFAGKTGCGNPAVVQRVEGLARILMMSHLAVVESVSTGNCAEMAALARTASCGYG